MTHVIAARHKGMALVYDTNDVARLDFSTPHDVIEDDAGHKSLGTAHLNISIDFLPGKGPRWIPEGRQ